MARLSLLSGFAALMLTAAPAFAQEVGGIQLTPQVLNTADAQQQAMNLALSLLQRAQLAQQLQMSHGMALAQQGFQPSPPTSPNAVNPSAGRSAINQQTIANLRGDPGFLAGFSGGQPLAASRLKPLLPPPTFIDQSHTFVVNAVESPVSIGNGNIVHQQVVNTTAISRGGPVIAGASANQGNPSGGASVSQHAMSSALSYSGTAQSTASNSSTVQR